MGTFLVDLWCCGLKDALGYVGVDRDQYDDAIDRMRENMDVDFSKANIEKIGQVVAGGVRFARKNGFRLPKGWEKWAGLLGKLDFESADINGSGKDGKLTCVGPQSDLKARLIGSPVQDFVARPDVDVILEAEGGEVGSFDQYRTMLMPMSTTQTMSMRTAIDRLQNPVTRLLKWT